MSGNHYVSTVLHEGDVPGALAINSNIRAVDPGSSLTVLVPEGREDLADLLAARGIKCSFGPSFDKIPTRGEAEFRMFLETAGMSSVESVVFVRSGFVLRQAGTFGSTFAAMAERNSRFETIGSHMPLAFVRPNEEFAHELKKDFETRLKRIRSRGEHLTFPAFILESEILSSNISLPLQSDRVVDWIDLEDTPEEQIASAVGVYVDLGHTPWFQGVASTRFSLNLRRTGQWSRLATYQLLESYSSGARSTLFEPSSARSNIEEFNLKQFNNVHASNPYKEIGSVVIRQREGSFGQDPALQAELFYDVQNNRTQIENLLTPDSDTWSSTDAVRDVTSSALRAGLFKMAASVIIAPNITPGLAARIQCEAAVCGAVPIVVGSMEGYPLRSPRLGSSPSARHAVSLAVTLSRSAVLRQTEAHKLGRQVLETHSDVHTRSASFFCTSMRPYELNTVLANFSRQNIRDKELILGTHGFNVAPEELRQACDITNTDPGSVKLVELSDNWVLGECLNEVISHCEGDLFIRYDDDEYYAPNYARDALLALEYSSAELVGKRAFYLYSEQYHATGLIGPELECRYVDHVMGGTFCGRREVFKEFSFQPVPSREDALFLIELARAGGKIYSSDRFNFSMNRKADVSRHTWNSNIDDFFIDGTILAPGFAENLISV